MCAVQMNEVRDAVYIINNSTYINMNWNIVDSELDILIEAFTR